MGGGKTLGVAAAAATGAVWLLWRKWNQQVAARCNATARCAALDVELRDCRQQLNALRKELSERDATIDALKLRVEETIRTAAKQRSSLDDELFAQREAYALESAALDEAKAAHAQRAQEHELSRYVAQMEREAKQASIEALQRELASLRQRNSPQQQSTPKPSDSAQSPPTVTSSTEQSREDRRARAANDSARRRARVEERRATAAKLEKAISSGL